MLDKLKIKIIDWILSWVNKKLADADTLAKCMPYVITISQLSGSLAEKLADKELSQDEFQELLNEIADMLKQIISKKIQVVQDDNGDNPIKEE